MANGGFQRMSGDLVEKFDDIFKKYDYIVTPSVSCAAFVQFNHPQLHKHKMFIHQKKLWNWYSSYMMF